MFKTINHDPYAYVDKTVEKKLNLTEERIEAKKRQLDDIQNEYELLLRQGFDLCRNNILYVLFHKALMGKAFEWYWCKRKGVYKDGSKINNRKNYSEKFAYDQIVGSLSKCFEINNFEVTVFRQASDGFNC